MKIINDLLNFKIEGNNSELMLTDDYTWKTTPNRTQSHDFADQILRFSNKVNVLTNTLNDLLSQDKLKTNFSILELFCGNGIVLHMIKQKFTECIPIGIDMLHFEMWDDINAKYPDVHFVQCNFFNIYKADLNMNLDVMITYNTWRGWDNPYGPGINNNITANQFMEWATKNFKYIVADNTIIT